MSDSLLYVPVRFRTGSKTYTFSISGFMAHPHDSVVVETKRGLEIGQVTGEANSSSGLAEGFEIKPVIRLATQEDLAKEKELIEKAKESRRFAQKEADKLDLKMNFISAEYTLDEAKITLTYLSDNRVDFRELLKVLANHFHCRIDLRQVGARDKAKMVGGIGVCGRELCCCSFLNDFETVSIKMAKEQNISLNPSKISGNCGRLMCCLKYEQDVYEEKVKKLPNIGAIVKTPDGQGEVEGLETLKEVVKVKIKDGEIFKIKRYDAKDIKVIKDVEKEHTDSEEKEYQKELKELEKLEKKEAKLKEN